MSVCLQSLILILVSFVVSWASAEVRMESPHLWRRAKALAPGQKVLSFETSYQKSENRFSADGRVEPIGSQYARTLNWKQLLASETGVAQQDLRRDMVARGLSENDVVATSDYSIQNEELSFDFNWAYGLTSNWMIGLRAPLTHRTTRVRQSFEMPNPDLAAKVKALAEQQLANSGYDHIPDQHESWDWGDVSLLSQESLWQTYRWTWALQQVVRFPTAQSPSVSDYIQSSTDEGQFDLGMTSLLDYQRRNWLLGLRLGYVAQLPDTRRMHVPSSDASSTGEQVDPTVRRDLGDWVWASVDTEIRVARKLDLTAEHSFLTKGRDHYSGQTKDGVSYDNLADHTDQQLQQTRVGVSYRLGSSSTREGILNRWVASMDYVYPWTGRNSLESSHATVELINYF